MKRVQDKMNRRNFLSTTAVACLGGISQAWAQEADHEVRIVLNYGRGLWYYDPVGLYVQPGETVQWTALRWTPTVTAFHPDHGNHELRIPEGDP
jgi:plastocyanin